MICWLIIVTDQIHCQKKRCSHVCDTLDFNSMKRSTPPSKWKYKCKCKLLEILKIAFWHNLKAVQSPFQSTNCHKFNRTWPLNIKTLLWVPVSNFFQEPSSPRPNFSAWMASHWPSLPRVNTSWLLCTEDNFALSVELSWYLFSSFFFFCIVDKLLFWSEPKPLPTVNVFSQCHWLLFKKV